MMERVMSSLTYTDLYVMSADAGAIECWPASNSCLIQPEKFLDQGFFSHISKELFFGGSVMSVLI
jgi:hypothetical protein